MLSEKVKELIEKSRIVSFDDWSYPNHVLEIFRQADDEGRYLTDEDIASLEKMQPELSVSLQQGKLLRDKVKSIVSQAREVVIHVNPLLIEPGGGLFPPVRAEACWRDFWHFLRCISYGISGQSINYTSDRGLKYMEQLYQELQVPLDSMVLGLEQLKQFSLAEFETAQRQELAPYFDHLTESMRQFLAVT